MYTLALISMLWVVQPAQGDTVSLVSQAKEQAEHYIQHFKMGEDQELHLWALSTLCQSNHPELSHFINRQIEKDPSFQSFEKPFCSDGPLAEQLSRLAFSFNSENLLLAAILEERDTHSKRKILDLYQERVGFDTNELEFQTIINHVIENKTIETEDLPIDRFYFAHFLLLYNQDFSENGGVSTDYLNTLTETWYKRNTNINKATLLHSLYQATLFRAIYLLNDYAKSYRLYSGLTTDELMPVSQLRLRIFQYLSFSMVRLGYYDKSLKILRTNSLPLAKFHDVKESEMLILITQGVNLWYIGKMQESIDIFEHVLEQSYQQNIQVPQATVFTNLGLAYLKTGNFDKYLELQFKALELARQQNDYSKQISILRNLYIVEKNNKNKKSAYSYLTSSKEIAIKYNKPDLLGELYTSLGSYYKDMEADYDSAHTYYTMADSLLDPGTNYNTYLKLQFEKAELNRDLDRFDKAIAIYKEIQDLAETKTDQKNFLDAHVRRTELLLIQGKLDEVSERLRQLQNWDLDLLDFKMVVKAQTVQADYLLQTGDRGEAYAILKPTIEQIFNWTKNSTDLKSGFWNVEKEYLDAFQLFTDLLINSGRSEEALLTLDRLKTINDGELYQNPLVRASRLNETELNQYRRLTNQLDRLRKRLLSSPGDGTVEIQSQIDRLNAQKRILDRKITRLADEKQIALYEVQRQLSGGDVILHITELNNQYYMATVTRRDVRYRMIDLDRDTRTMFVETLEQLSQGHTDLHKLYRIGEILHISDLPVTADHVIMIPDSYLFQLPIDIIPLDPPANNYSYGSTSYFIEQYGTEYLTSLNELKPAKQPETSFTWDYAGFGISNFESNRNRNESLIPLPHASNEVTQIAGVLDNLDSHLTILNENSTEKRFRETAPMSKILHLATHSRVSEQDPLFSTIYMSTPSDQPEEERLDSQIYAYELFEMNLASDLVMLNSCESGSGSYLQGSGIVGISRALRYAGAQSLILNLWSVNDMLASDFAIRFYMALNTGENKSAALRQAKLYFLKNKNANPHYWGPYMMLGSDRPIVHPYRAANLWFAAGFMFYLFAVVSLSYIAQKKNGNG